MDYRNMGLDQKAEAILRVREMFPEVAWKDTSVEDISVFGFPEMKSSGWKANVVWEDEEPTIVGVTSTQYQFLPYEIITASMLEIAERFPTFGPPKAQPVILQGGRKFVCDVTFPESEIASRMTLRKGDPIAPKFGCRSSLDLTWAYTSYTGAVRLVCTNGMVAWKVDQQVRKKHRQSLDLNTENLLTAEALNSLEEQVLVWQKWGDAEINGEEAVEFLGGLPFGNKGREEILMLPEKSTGESLQSWINGGRVNALNFYNVLTQYMTHNIESVPVRVEKEQEVSRSFHRRFR